MARLQLCDGRKRLYQWDTGVEIEICECKTVTECHFVTPSGLVKGEVKNNICKVPDSVLTHSGCLIVYAFARDGVYGTTRHDFRLNVITRPKPADYIDATDESTAIDAICDRLKVLPECKGEKGEPGADGTDANVTAANIAGALGYTPANQEDVNSLSEDKADKFTVGEGLKMSDGRLLSAVGTTLSDMRKIAEITDEEETDMILVDLGKKCKVMRFFIQFPQVIEGNKYVYVSVSNSGHASNFGNMSGICVNNVLVVEYIRFAAAFRQISVFACANKKGNEVTSQLMLGIPYDESYTIDETEGVRYLKFTTYNMNYTVGTVITVLGA